MYKKNNNNNYQRKQRLEYENNDKINHSGKPVGDDSPSLGISNKSMRGLPHSSYSIKADPYTAVDPSSNPYSILNSFNPNVGGQYGGLRNLDGNNVQQYPNNTFSAFLKYFDYMRLKLNVRYRYLPNSQAAGDNYKLTPGVKLIDEQRKAMSETISTLKATTFTNLEINNVILVPDNPTTFPKGSGEYETVTIDGQEGVQIISETSDVIYHWSRFYQQYLLAFANFITWFNASRLKMGTLIRRSWNREIDKYKRLFGLLKKKSFLTEVSSIAGSLQGEYMDAEFVKQAAMLNAIHSSRSDSITDPVLELQTIITPYDNFTLRLRTGSTITEPFFDTKAFSVEVDGENISYEDLIDEAQDMLSAQYIAKWARNESGKNINSSYWNRLNILIQSISASITKFKVSVGMLREVFDIMKRTGTVYWVNDFRQSITSDTDAPSVNNLMINDIFKNTCCGADRCTLNPDTLRWSTFTMWNMYTGIPEYDASSGGAFLTFSMKDLYANSDTIVGYVPICLESYPYQGHDYPIFATNREGGSVTIVSEVKKMSDDPVLARLVPLPSQSEYKIRVPYILETVSDTQTRSILYKTLTQIFGFAKIASSADPVTYDYSLDPDIIAVYNIEIEDISNEMLTYAKYYAPFRTISTSKPTVGFLSF